MLLAMSWIWERRKRWGKDERLLAAAMRRAAPQWPASMLGSCVMAYFSFLVCASTLARSSQITCTEQSRVSSVFACYLYFELSQKIDICDESFYQ